VDFRRFRRWILCGSRRFCAVPAAVRSISSIYGVSHPFSPGSFELLPFAALAFNLLFLEPVFLLIFEKLSHKPLGPAERSFKKFVGIKAGVCGLRLAAPRGFLVWYGVYCSEREECEAGEVVDERE